jgi:hypothetical protein
MREQSKSIAGILALPVHAGAEKEGLCGVWGEAPRFNKFIRNE